MNLKVLEMEGIFEKKTIDAIVTFTFRKSKNLGDYFVAALKEKYGVDNLIHIDQSTYGITTKDTVSLDDVINILLKVDENNEKCNDGDILSYIAQKDYTQIILTRSFILNERIRIKGDK